MQNLLVALRAGTKGIHSALHENKILKRCQENQLVLSEYVGMLLAFYQPWKKLMASIELIPVDNLSPLLIRRHKLLYDDLIALGVDEKELAIYKKEPVSLDDLLGMCYVVIGSSMGASLLSQNIKTSLGNQPVSYLSMSPKQAGWPLLSSYLSSQESIDYPKASETAEETFKLIEAYLSKCS